MIVTCERCNARYKLDDSRIKGRGARITCPKCRHVFTVLTNRPAEEADEPTADTVLENPPDPGHVVEVHRPPRAARPEAPARSADHLDFRRVGIPTWKVKVKIGLIYDFSDIRTLRKYIQDRRVTEDDVISWDGARWTRIGDIEDLDSFFLQIYQDREANLKPDAPREPAQDAPTMILETGALGVNISTGVFPRPQADAGAVPLVVPERPAPTGGDAAVPRFVDPFEALKKSRPRDDGRGTTRRRAGTGTAAVTSRSRTPVVVLLAVLAAVAVLAGGWFLAPGFSVPKPSPPPSPSAISMGPGNHPDFRERMIDRIEERLEQRDPIPIEPELDVEPEEALRPVVPAGVVARGGIEVSTPGLAPSLPQGAVTQAPATGADHVAAGDSMVAAGDWNAAMGAYARAVAMDPGNPRYRVRYGEALYRAGRLDEAKAEFQAATGAGLATGHKFLGHIARDQGDAADAVAHYQEYLQSNPADRAAIEQEVRNLSGG